MGLALSIDHRNDKRVIVRPTGKSPSRGAKLAEQRRALREQLFPGVTDDLLWDRKREVGFATIPRTLPLIMQIMDSLTKNNPVSSTYLDLWARAFDEGFVRLDKPAEMAVCSGFLTARGPGIWASRLDLLARLKFISLAPGPQGERAYALIFNPYIVVQAKREEIDRRLFNSFLAQALAIGADVRLPPGMGAPANPFSPLQPAASGSQAEAVGTG